MTGTGLGVAGVALAAGLGWVGVVIFWSVLAKEDLKVKQHI